MTGGTLFLIVIGAAYATSWLFKIIDLIEKPAKRYSR